MPISIRTNSHRSGSGCFRYDEINASKLAGWRLFGSADPSDVVLSIFCDDVRSPKHVDDVFEKLRTMVAEPTERSKFLRAFDIFCDLFSSISDYAEERMPPMAFEFEINKDSMFYPVFEEAVARAEAAGRAEGQQIGEARGFNAYANSILRRLSASEVDFDIEEARERMAHMTLDELTDFDAQISEQLTPGRSEDHRGL